MIYVFCRLKKRRHRCCARDEGKLPTDYKKALPTLSLWHGGKTMKGGEMPFAHSLWARRRKRRSPARSIVALPPLCDGGGGGALSSSLLPPPEVEAPDLSLLEEGREMGGGRLLKAPMMMDGVSHGDGSSVLLWRGDWRMADRSSSSSSSPLCPVVAGKDGDGD